MTFIKFFNEIRKSDINLVGGKNSALGEMVHNLKPKGINIPMGFAITCDAYHYYLEQNDLIIKIKNIIDNIKENNNLDLLSNVGSQIRELILKSKMPQDLISEIAKAYEELGKYYKTQDLDVAIRSSATAEDLPNASFAGQQETFLHIQGINEVIDSVKKCLASLFTDRAIAYRIEKKFDHFKIGISVGVQKMVRSDLASSGVIFTLDTESGFKDVIVINSSYGLGENIVQGFVNPDEFHVHKPTLNKNFCPIIKKDLGTKETQLVYTNRPQNQLKKISVLKDERNKFSITDCEIIDLAKQAIIIEQYFSDLQGSWCPMDIEWAKDGIDNQLYIVQARPETVNSQMSRKDVLTLYKLNLKDQIKPEIILEGQSIGRKIANGTAKVLNTISDVKNFNTGDILITSMTDPDWVPLMKKAGAIITDQGGRTCHAAIVSRELGIPAIVGTIKGTEIIKDQSKITVDCSQGSIGYIYDEIINYKTENIYLDKIPKSPVDILLNIGDPNQAYELSFLPVSGIGLARVEFIISNTIKIHPLAAALFDQLQDKKLINQIKSLSVAYQDPKSFFINKLAEGIATLAASFYPKSVIVRLSDFKTNEYRNLLGGYLFEPKEENPMLGFRGAVRYCSQRYQEAFELECLALKKAIFTMGMSNIKLMIPFVRTVEDAKCTLSKLKEFGLDQKNGLQIYIMCEIPSNVILLEEFEFFDGFSIGSNDLTQLTLGVDRDSPTLSNIYNEKDPAMLKMFQLAISKAKKMNKPIGICGQAPSDFPDLAQFLINEGIDSLSLNADSVIPFLLSLK